MEAVSEAQARFGRPMEREKGGHTGGGQLFLLRRETDFQRGLLSENGYNNNYLAFKPSNLFMRVLGDDVFRLNEALFEFRSQAVGQLMVLDDEAVEAHYGELNRRTEVVRDRVQSLIEYCNKGFDRLLDEALKMAEEWIQQTTEAEEDGLGAMKAFGPLGPDVYEAVRRRNADDGVLTEVGSKQGYVAFKACPFYGRVVGEVVYTFNEALRRVEGRTPLYIQEGQVKEVRRYVVGLMRGMKLLRGEMEEVVKLCRAPEG